MKVKVVILNWNGERMLRRFLPSVVANTPPWAEVIVADNGSTDCSCELLFSNFANVAQLHFDRNWGFAEGYNRAFRELQARQDASAEDVYVLLNSDVETPPGWLEPLVAVLEECPEVAAVAPKLLSVNDPNSFEYAGASGGMVDFFGYPFCRGRVFGSVEKDLGQYDDRRQVMWGSGACLALRASALEKVGELDGDFFAHQEEIDWCWRAQLAGLSVVVEPKSVVYHLGGGTLKPSPSKTYLNFRNNLSMLYKNLPGGRLWLVLWVRAGMDFSIAMVYFVACRRDMARAVFRGWCDFMRMRRTAGEISGQTLREKRRKIQSTCITKPVGLGGLVVVEWLKLKLTNIRG